jgi:hypothetical protein
MIHAVRADVAVCVQGVMPTLSPGLDQQVETLWQAAAKRVAVSGAATLFNDRVFSADAITPHTITGHLTEFRRVVAQMEQPGLFGALRVRPLAVCGVLRCADGVVFGRRHGGAVYQAGMWQLPPAGSVDENAVGADGVVDIRRQLRTELWEALGLLADDVGKPVPLCVAEHDDSHVYDLGMALSTHLTGAEVVARHKRRSNAEYPVLRIVPLAELGAFLAAEADAVVTPARAFLARAMSEERWDGPVPRLV